MGFQQSCKLHAAVDKKTSGGHTQAKFLMSQMTWSLWAGSSSQLESHRVIRVACLSLLMPYLKHTSPVFFSVYLSWWISHRDISASLPADSTIPPPQHPPIGSRRIFTHHFTIFIKFLSSFSLSLCFATALFLLFSFSWSTTITNQLQQMVAPPQVWFSGSFYFPPLHSAWS